ncbi:hypothetical protein Goari_002494, partial [Gossypium aridum]|nr:hypothetical protein [Gossypium aridum]
MESFSASASSLAIEFQEGDMEKYLQQLQLYIFIQEQEFDHLMRNCKGMWDNAIEREWKKFCLPSKEPLIIPDRGINVSVIEMCICQIYDVPYYYHDYLYKTDMKEFRNIDTEEILRFLTEGKE